MIKKRGETKERGKVGTLEIGWDQSCWCDLWPSPLSVPTPSGPLKAGGVRSQEPAAPSLSWCLLPLGNQLPFSLFASIHGRSEGAGGWGGGLSEVVLPGVDFHFVTQLVWAVCMCVCGYCKCVHQCMTGRGRQRRNKLLVDLHSNVVPYWKDS